MMLLVVRRGRGRAGVGRPRAARSRRGTPPRAARPPRTSAAARSGRTRRWAARSAADRGGARARRDRTRGRRARARLRADRRVRAGREGRGGGERVARLRRRGGPAERRLRGERVRHRAGKGGAPSARAPPRTRRETLAKPAAHTRPRARSRHDAPNDRTCRAMTLWADDGSRMNGRRLDSLDPRFGRKTSRCWFIVLLSPPTPAGRGHDTGSRAHLARVTRFARQPCLPRRDRPSALAFRPRERSRRARASPRAAPRAALAPARAARSPPSVSTTARRSTRSRL